MAVYVKPLRMVDPAGHQSSARDQIATLNPDDPAGIALTVDAGTATAISGGMLYWVCSDEDDVVFLRVGTAGNQLATAVHLPIGPKETHGFYFGAGVTHIHAGSGA